MTVVRNWQDTVSRYVIHTVSEIRKYLHFILFQKKKILTALKHLKKLRKSSTIFAFHTNPINFFATYNWKCPPQNKQKICNLTTESQYLMAGIA